MVLILLDIITTSIGISQGNLELNIFTNFLYTKIGILGIMAISGIGFISFYTLIFLYKKLKDLGKVVEYSMKTIGITMVFFYASAIVSNLEVIL